VREVLPGSPAPVLKQLLFDHYRDFVSTYGWLGLSQLCLEGQAWSTERVIVEIHGHDELIDQQAGHFVQRPNAFPRASRIWDHVLQHGTWPLGVVVIANRCGNLQFPWGVPLGTPSHLVEGHHRLGAIRAADSMGIPLAKAHQVWVAT
jgi:hypothetical protein